MLKSAMSARTTDKKSSKCRLTFRHTAITAMLLLAAVLLSSCGYDELGVKNNVQTKFPKAKEIIRLAGKDYTYIIIDSVGNIWWAESTSPYNTSIDKIELLSNCR